MQYTSQFAAGVETDISVNLAVGGTAAITPQTKTINFAGIAAAGAVTGTNQMVLDEQYQVAAVSANLFTASSSGTLQVEILTGTTAPGSGTNQLTGTVSIAGSANTVVTGTIIASPTTAVAGSRLSLVFAGTVTSLVGLCVTVTLRRV